MKPSLRERWRLLIDSPYLTLQLFAVGSLIFFCGLGALVYVDRNLSVTLDNELLALLAIAVLACGFLIVITAQVLFILQRLRR